MTLSLTHRLLRSVMFNFRVLGDFLVLFNFCFFFYGQFSDFVSFKHVSVCFLAQNMVSLGECSCTLEKIVYFPLFEYRLRKYQFRLVDVFFWSPPLLTLFTFFVDNWWRSVAVSNTILHPLKILFQRIPASILANEFIAITMFFVLSNWLFSLIGF